MEWGFRFTRLDRFDTPSASSDDACYVPAFPVPVYPLSHKDRQMLISYVPIRFVGYSAGGSARFGISNSYSTVSFNRSSPTVLTGSRRGAC